MTKTAEPTSFDEAVSRFELFLKENDHSANLIWVEPSDLVCCERNSIYVKLPVPTTNISTARNRFDHGFSTGLGVTFGTICDLRDATCCYSWVPKDKIEQQYHLMNGGLKMSARAEPSRLNGIIVGTRFRWWLLKLRYRRPSRLKESLFG